MEIQSNTLNLKTFDIKQHDIYLNGDITEAQFKTFQKEINEVVKEDEYIIRNNLNSITQCNFISNQSILEFQRPDINIYMSTYGGIVYEAFAYYDLITSLKEKYNVNIYCSGKIMSAGTIILQAATKRIASKNTFFMVHDISSESWGKLEDVINSVEHCKVLKDLMTNIYLEHTSFTKKQLDDIFGKQKDFYFDADNALNKYGFIDEIR